MSKDNPNLDLNKGFSKLSDVLESRDRAFQHLKNIQDITERFKLTGGLFFRTEAGRKMKGVKGYGTRQIKA